MNEKYKPIICPKCGRQGIVLQLDAIGAEEVNRYQWECCCCGFGAGWAETEEEAMRLWEKAAT